MPFEIHIPTRHNDTYADTPYVHAGVMLALTEMAYAAFEIHCGIQKPENVLAVQRSTEASYRSPMRWNEGATIKVRTVQTDESSFVQEFEVHSTASEPSLAAVFRHRWVWLDTKNGQRQTLSAEDQRRLLEG